MARLNIEESWWTDPRRKKLADLVGCEFKADGIALYFWRVAQEYWKKDRQPIPKSVFEVIESNQNIIEAKLCFYEPNMNGFFAFGSSENFDWIIEKKKSASKAGKASAAARLRQYGSSKPQKSRTSDERKRTPMNKGERSSSSSSSSSSSNSIIPYSSNTGEIASQSPENLNQENSITVSSGKKPEVISGEDWNPVAIWMKAWGEKYKSRYPLQGKDTGSLKAIRKNFSLEQAQVLIAAYLSIGKPLYADNRHPLSLFFRDLPLIAEAAQTGNNPHISPEDAKKQKKDALLKKLKGEENKNDLRKIFE